MWWGEPGLCRDWDSSTMTGENGSNSNSNTGTGTACAACKYQRRKCASDCPLSPYFPADQPKRFANVHRLFGVSNTLRILKHVDPSKRDDTVKAIAYEADTREKDPVHGCLGVIAVLQNQVTKLKEELRAAREQMFLMEHQQAMAVQQQQLNPLTFHGRGAFDVEEDSQFCLGDPKLSSLPLDFARYDHGELQQQLQQQQQQLRRSSVGGYMGMENSSYDESPVSHHQMHTMASLDHDPSYHLRSNNSYGYHHHHPESDMKRENYLLGGSTHLSDHELRRAGVYLSLRNHQH